MSRAWVEAAIAATALTTPAAPVLRGLIDLWRYRMRRASVERVTAKAVPGTRIVDRDSDGAVMDLTISSDAAQTPSRSALVCDKPRE